VAAERRLGSVIQEHKRLKLADFAAIISRCLAALGSDPVSETILKKLIHIFVQTNVDVQTDEGDVVYYDAAKGHVHISLLPKIISHFLHCDFLDEHLEAVLKNIVPADAPIKKRRYNRREPPPLESGALALALALPFGPSQAAERFHQTAIVPLQRYATYSHTELQHLLLQRDADYSALAVDLSKSRHGCGMGGWLGFT
jgi:hypothetical protein